MDTLLELVQIELAKREVFLLAELPRQIVVAINEDRFRHNLLGFVRHNNRAARFLRGAVFLVVRRSQGDEAER